jgi:hypothetical protein
MILKFTQKKERKFYSLAEVKEPRVEARPTEHVP